MPGLSQRKRCCASAEPHTPAAHVAQSMTPMNSRAYSMQKQHKLATRQHQPSSLHEHTSLLFSAPGDAAPVSPSAQLSGCCTFWRQHRQPAANWDWLSLSKASMLLLLHLPYPTGHAHTPMLVQPHPQSCRLAWRSAAISSRAHSCCACALEEVAAHLHANVQLFGWGWTSIGICAFL